MPFKIVEEQQKFTFEINGAGLPLAHVTRWGNGVWVECCPLCGMLHEVLKGQTAGEFEPKCILKVTHPTVFAAWQQKHPDAIGKSMVMLVEKTALAIVPPAAKPTKQKTRRKQAA